MSDFHQARTQKRQLTEPDSIDFVDISNVCFMRIVVWSLEATSKASDKWKYEKSQNENEREQEKEGKIYENNRTQVKH